jgi:hypothetical protein
MEKIYISHWSKGEQGRAFEVTTDIVELIETFVRVFKKKNTQEIVFITDTEMSNKLNQYISENVTVVNSLDSFNDYEACQWPVVKTKLISEIEDLEVLHFDYDFFIDYDIDILINYLRDNNIDALYQFFESLSDSAKYYSTFIKNNPEFKTKLSQVKDKFGYNAGISYFSENAKMLLPSIIEQYSNQNYFGDCLSFEQMVIPTELKLNGLKVEALTNIFRNIERPENTYSFSELEIGGEFSKFNKKGIFISNINVFHLFGHIKNEPWVNGFLDILKN